MCRLFIFLMILTCISALPLGAQPLSLSLQADGALFEEAGDTVLFYQTAPKSLNGRYERSNYIHPLYGLDGAVLTEDFPADHLHHRGVFWAWHQIYIGEERIGDGWEIKDIAWKVTELEEIKAKGKARALRARVDWVSPLWTDASGSMKPFLKEEVILRVHPARKSYRLVDVELKLMALEPDMRLGGSEDPKGYGGFSPRIRMAEGIVFTGPQGAVEPETNPVSAEGWLDISAPIGKQGAWAGVSMLSHPDNPGYPNPWILRARGSMQNAVFPHPGAEAAPLPMDAPWHLKYRLVIHQGTAEAVNLGRLHKRYARTASRD